MSILMGIILGIFMFFVLVLLHELGHFLAAKKNGVKVLEFGIGIPPKLFKFYTDKSGTEYTINALPFGGFNRLKGEDPENSEEFNSRDSLIQAKIYKKIIIILAGVTMNFLTAWIIFTIVFVSGIKPISIAENNNTVVANARSYLIPSYEHLKEDGMILNNVDNLPVKINMIQENSTAMKIGLISGDVILKIDNKKTNPWNIGGIIQNLSGENHYLLYQRGNEQKTIDMICPNNTCFLGISYDKIGVLDIKDIKFSLPKAMLASLQEINAETKITFNALGKLGKDLLSFNQKIIKKSVNGLTGPVGAVKLGQLILKKDGRTGFLAFAGMISLALAIFNVLPIPALDGGRLLGMLIQRGAGLKAEKYFKIEGYINITFFVLLLLLGVYIMLKDLVNVWGVHIPFLG